VGAGVVVASLAGAGGWFLRVAIPVAEDAAEEHESEPAPSDACVEVVTGVAAEGELTTSLVVFGVVRSVEGDLRTVSSRAAGRIESVLARAGDEVRPGAVLFRIERAPRETALAQARAAAAAAETALATFDRGGRARKVAELRSAVGDARDALDVGSRQAERAATLRREGLSSERAKAEAELTAGKARRELELATRALDAYEATGADLERTSLLAARDAAVAAENDSRDVLDATEVKANVAARVVAVSVRVGDSVEGGAALAVLLAGDRREVAFRVTPSQRHRIPEHARVRWTGADGAARTGAVRAIAVVVDVALGLQEVLVDPDPGTAPDALGGLVRGEIETGKVAPAVLVPTRAIVRSAGTPSLVLVVGGVAKIVPVEVLGRHEGTSAIHGDVKAGDVVVLDGAYNLPAGAQVHAAQGAEPKPGEGK
jgi:multidrug efflux pump subunit AcrA (membrane-fusion protein)